MDMKTLSDTDWEQVLSKRAVGRPRKPRDPFKRDVPASKQRVTLKSLGEQLDRIEKKIDARDYVTYERKHEYKD